MTGLLRSGQPGKHQLVLGLDLDAVTLEQALQRCEHAMQTREPLLVGVVNAAKIVNLRTDALLRDSLLNCNLLLADGQSVVWASRLLRRPLPERVAGIDLFEELLRLGAQQKRSVYLLGARPEVLKALVQVIEAHFPGLRIAGAHDGYFDPTQSADVADEIRSAAPDMLFLGMTSPKKEIFLGAFGSTLGVPVLHGVGGSFDVLAGVVQRAPEKWRHAGMEWAYRLVQEPKRLAGRYARTNTIFLGLLAHDLIRETPAYTSSGSNHA